MRLIHLLAALALGFGIAMSSGSAVSSGDDASACEARMPAENVQELADGSK